MLEHYSHVRLEAKRHALDALSSKHPESQNQGASEGGYVTRSVTKSGLEGIPEVQVLDLVGGDDGARTRDLMRDSSTNDNSNKSRNNA